MSGAEWMKGICHIWSRGRHFSPSMPGSLAHKSDLRDEISGSIVRYDALAPRPEVLLYWCWVSAYCFIGVGLAHAQSLKKQSCNHMRE